MTWKEFKEKIEHSGILNNDRIQYIITDDKPESEKMHVEKIHDSFYVYSSS